MKSLVCLTTVLMMSGLPLTAAALDYGPNQRFLAAESRAPSLPAPAAETATFSDPTSPRAGGGVADAADPAPHAMARGNARRKTHAAMPAQGAGIELPQHADSPLSWQSLLPGSIQ